MVSWQAFEDVEKLRLQEKLSDIQVLRSTLHDQLRESYPTFVPYCRDRPHERMPVLKDPTLVRGAQLAILEIAKDPKAKDDVESVVAAYQRIERAFRTLLRDRLNANSKINIHEQWPQLL